MKLNHKTTLFIYLALVRSFLFAGDVSTANKADHTTVGQTYSTYNGTSTTEFDSVIPSSELNGISNSDYFENYNHQDVDRYNSHGNESNNLNTTIMSRDDETIYQFTNCGQTGRTGPSQSQTDNAYAGTSLDGAVTVSGGIQSWTVPTTGDYTIDSYGAQGGGPNGGLGAWMSGTFPLTAGQTIKVLVGQMGSYSAPMTTGGGGSFVATSTNAPMIVAGGGGAASQVGSGNQNGNTTITGGVAYGGWPDVGLQTYNAGTSGNGGDGSSGSGGGGGGGGFSTNGNDDDAFGYSFLNGGVGGSGGLSGGFGGGGGARNNGNNYWGGGAGGGYSGGGGGGWSSGGWGGAGGSYNDGTDQDNTEAFNPGDGYVIITKLGSSKGGTISMVEGTTPFYTTVTNPYNLTLNQDESSVITWLVNATGDLNITHEFFIYANKTSSQSIGAITNIWNVTTVDAPETTPPTLSIVTPTNNSNYSDNGLNINYTFGDSVYCWYSNDSYSVNNSLSSCENITSVVWSEGTHNLTIWANDSLNNVASTFVSFTIDSVKPLINVISPVNGANSSNKGLNVNYTFVGVSNCWYSNDSYSKNTTLAGCGNITSVVWSEGQHNVSVWVNDSAGNVNSSSVSFTIDSVTPLVNVVSPANETNSSDNGLDVNYTYSDLNVDECWYSNDSYAVNTSLVCGVNITSVVWSEGQHNVSVWVNDSAGNVNSSSVSFTIDTINPQVNIIFPLNNLDYSKNNLNVNFTYLDINLDECWYSNDSMSVNNSLSSCENITSVVWSEGQHNVSVWVNDSAGNINSSSVGFTIDSLAPNITSITPVNDSATNNSQVNFFANIEDSGVGIDNATLSIYNETGLYQETFVEVGNVASTTIGVVVVLTEGIYTWFWTVIDVVANVITSQNQTTGPGGNYTVTYDATDPAINISLPYDGYQTSDPTPEVKFIITDNIFTNINYSVYIDNAIVNHSGDGIALNNTEEIIIITSRLELGQHNLSVQANDSAGNLITSNIINMTIVPPTVYLRSPTYNEYLNDVNVSLEFDVTDPSYETLNCSMYFDGVINQTKNSTRNILDSFNVSNLEDKNNYNWTVHCFNEVDAYSNDTFIFNVDTINPLVSVVSPANLSNSSNDGLNISYTRSDLNLDSCWYSNDSYAVNISLGNNGNCTNITSVIWTEGMHNITIWTNDSAGNENDSLVSFTIDTILPNATLLAPENTSYNSTTSQNFTVNLTDNLGLKNATLNIYNSSGNLVNQTTTSFFGNVLKYTLGVVVVLTDGVYDWFYDVFDIANNNFLTENNTITIDTINTLINVVSPANGTNSSDTGLDVNYTYSDTNLDECWYSNDSYGVNTSLTCGVNITSVVWSEGQHNVIVWANDSAGNVNSSFVSFTIDTITPLVSVVSPANGTNSSDTGLNVNYTYSDLSVDECWYSNDSYSVNSSLADCENITSVVWSEGQHNVSIWVNDSAGNVNNSFVSFTIDTTPPYFTTIPSNTTIDYLQGFGVDFDGADSFAFGNYSINWTNTFSINSSGWLINSSANLAVGNYGINVSINDSVGNENSTFYNVVVNPITVGLMMIFNQSNNVSYGTDVNITGANCPSQLNCLLHRNDSGVVPNAQNVNLGVGVYNYTYNTSGNNNYSSESASSIFIVNQVSSTLNLTLNYTRGNVYIENVTTIDLNCSIISGDAGATLNLYRNGTLINSGISPIGNSTDFNDIQDENITCMYEDSQNYTSSSETWWAYVRSVDRSVPVISIDLINNSYYPTNSLAINYSVEDENVSSCWYSNDSYALNRSLLGVSSCLNITDVSWTEGQHDLTIWANDSVGNNGSSLVSFFIDSINPLIYYGVGTEGDGVKLTKDNIYVNVSVTELNEVNITFNLYYSNGTSVNSTTYTDSSRVINWTDLADDSYKFNVTVYDDASNSNLTLTRSVSTDSVIPGISIISPANQTYVTSLINFNIVASENLSSCILSMDDWVTNYSMSLNSSLNGASFVESSVYDGSYAAKFWCEDISGNVNNSESVGFRVDTVNPVVNIAFPFDNAYLNYNESISFNYSIASNDTDTCWYFVDGGSNQTIASCANITLDLSEGNHLVELWLNDTANLRGSDNVNFTIDLTEPWIGLINPSNDSMNMTTNTIDFYYNVSDTNSISNCSLIIEDSINQSVVGPGKNQVNNFSVYLLNGNYDWSVNCTDIAGNVNSSEVRVIEVNYSTVVDDSVFDGGSTDFAERINNSELSNITNLTLGKIAYGDINFLYGVDLSEDLEDNVLNFTKYVNISYNRIYVNSSALTGLNSDARLRLFNLTFTNPQILRDDIVCSDCVEESYTNGTLTFNVTGFSVYSARETPSVVAPPAASPSSGGGGSSSIIECKKNSDCNDDYSCYAGKCVKLFDVEIILINPLIEHLNFELDYLIKGMADINNDVIVEFWIENDGEKVMLGKDTIYLGSFEEKRKKTKLNLPARIPDGDYDLYVQSSYEGYSAQSFRKINIRVPEKVRLEEMGPFFSPGVRAYFNAYLWFFIILLGLIVVALLMKKTRVIILSWLVYIKEKIKNPRMHVSFKDTMHEEEDEEKELEEREKMAIQKVAQRKKEILPVRDMRPFPMPRAGVNIGKSLMSLPENIVPIKSLAGKKVYGASGNFIGVIEKANLGEKRITGWIIKPKDSYNIQKSIWIKHEAVIEIKDKFIVDKKVEDYLERIKKPVFPSEKYSPDFIKKRNEIIRQRNLDELKKRYGGEEDFRKRYWSGEGY
ncbi:hypothetical protein HOE04_02975 [archaeon]|nr:hypothetical protein [archaeon]